MLALSVRQPWGAAIIHGSKRIENRGFATNYRGPVMICSSAAVPRAEYDPAKDAIESLEVAEEPPVPWELPEYKDRKDHDWTRMGYALGLATIIGCAHVQPDKVRYRRLGARRFSSTGEHIGSVGEYCSLEEDTWWWILGSRVIVYKTPWRIKGALGLRRRIKAAHHAGWPGMADFVSMPVSDVHEVCMMGGHRESFDGHWAEFGGEAPI